MASLQVPLRPNFGRIERTRFNALAHSITPLFRGRFAERLEKVVTNAHARAIHSVAHGGLDFHTAFLLSKKLQIPFFLQVHDDVAYTSAGRVSAQSMGEVWQGASARFVISRELGDEYVRRYGPEEFVVVTDGLDRLAAKLRTPTDGLRIYFMGLFHIGYEKNLEALIKAIQLLPVGLTSKCSITLRCDYIRPALLRQTSLLRVLPFGSESDVQADLAEADCLYLPLHFGEADRPFAAYSLSTKMVTYLGSGLPILYHGPIGTAAYNLLEKHRAAALATSLAAQRGRGCTHKSFEAEHCDRSWRRTQRNWRAVRSCVPTQHNKFWERVLPALHSAAELSRELFPART